MEGRRDDVTAGVVAAAWRRTSGGGGDGGEESDRSSGVELSLRLRTGDSSSAPPAAAEEEERQAAARRRNVTIFYGGRVCAVDVTEVQARAIISMANEEIIMAAAEADHHRQQQCHQRDRQLQDRGSSSAAVARCARDGHVRPAAVASSPAAGSPRQGFAAVAAAPVIDQAASGRLSMKRSLQRFLQKRKARTAGAVAPPYAGGWHAQAMRH